MRESQEGWCGCLGYFPVHFLSSPLPLLCLLSLSLSVGQCRTGNRSCLWIILSLVTLLFRLLPFIPLTRMIRLPLPEEQWTGISLYSFYRYREKSTWLGYRGRNLDHERFKAQWRCMKHSNLNLDETKCFRRIRDNKHRLCLQRVGA